MQRWPIILCLGFMSHPGPMRGKKKKDEDAATSLLLFKCANFKTKQNTRHTCTPKLV